MPASATIDKDRDESGWSASAYNVGASFVYSSTATAPVLSLLDARPGEKILDFGCGSGEVTKQVKEQVGEEGVVVGVDISSSMIKKAIEVTGFPSRNLLVADLQTPNFPGPGTTIPEFPPELVGEKFDKVFTTATMHWCSRDPKQALVNAWNVLKPGGRIIGEMGGYGNVAGIREALHKVLNERGIDAAARDPWYFPSDDEYAKILTSAGFKPIHVSLHERPTPADSLKAWLRSFVIQNFLKDLNAIEQEEMIEKTEEICKKDARCWDAEGKRWCLGYVRLRFVADKA